MNLPDVFKKLAYQRMGLVLSTGPTGSGKSTTQAAIINEINHNRQLHIMTLEDPIEYLHKHNKSLVHQREIGSDTNNFKRGLRACLRQDPDVILVGEMRDLETIQIALEAAETGHLVLATLHTNSAPATIDRIIDVFPAAQQDQIKIQLASVISAVIAQQLIPTRDQSGRAAAFEIMMATSAIRNIIREGKTNQIYSAIQTGGRYNMTTMDNSLLKLYKRGKISRESVLHHCNDIKYVNENLR
jgi:twitching motility protein PilT